MDSRKAAIYTGISLLIMAISAGFAYGMVHTEIFVKDNPQLTFEQLNQNRALLPVSVIGWGIIVITDLIVSWSLFKFIKPFALKKARVISGLRLVYTLILSVAVAQLFMAYSQTEAHLVYDLMKSFETVWSYGLIIFGIHLYQLGKTACSQHVLPKWINGLLVFGGMGYVLVSVGKVWFSDYAWVETIELVLSLPMAASELSMAVWMIIKGGGITSKALAS